jgi:hypothetical protein
MNIEDIYETPFIECIDLRGQGRFSGVFLIRFLKKIDSNETITRQVAWKIAGNIHGKNDKQMLVIKKVGGIPLEKEMEYEIEFELKNCVS